MMHCVNTNNTVMRTSTQTIQQKQNLSLKVQQGTTTTKRKKEKLKKTNSLMHCVNTNNTAMATSTQTIQQERTKLNPATKKNLKKKYITLRIYEAATHASINSGRRQSRLSLNRLTDSRTTSAKLHLSF